MIETPDAQGTSTRPYLLRALHDWCTDNGYTPYVAVHVGPGVQVPMEYVKNNEIVLNIGFEATSGLQLGNEFVEFKARFGGVSREIRVPVDHVVAIYARENGQGMAFPVPTDGARPAAGPAGAAPVRGLRLANSDTPLPSSALASAPSSTPSSTPSLLPAPSLPAPGAPGAPATPARGGSGEEPPEPTAPPSGRPSLKRVK